MPFNVNQARAAGYTDSEIVDHLAKETGLDAAGARSAGYSDAELLTHLLGNNPATGAPRTEGAGDLHTMAQNDLTQRKVQKARDQSAIDEKVTAVTSNPANPENSGGDFQNARAAFGKSFTDTATGVKQLASKLFSSKENDAEIQKDVDLTRANDAPLMRTGAGTAGNIVGGIAQAAPLLMVPGGATVLGSGATGAALAGAQPVATGESRLQNTTIGGLTGMAGPVIARTAGAGARAIKSLVEPLTEAGQQRIAGRTLERFGVQQSDLAGLSDAPTATGARPTLAERIQRPEGAAAAARLQDSIRAASPEVAAKLSAREGENNAARVATLEGLAAPRDAAVAARSSATKGLYDQANAATFQPTAYFVKLAERPAVKSALAQAQANIANSGGTAAPNSIELLHQTKLALDDAIATLRAAKPTAATSADATALSNAQRDLVSFIEKQAPDYATARSTYATMSKPVNQADIAGELLKRGSANTTDLSGNARLMPNALTGAVSDEGRLIKQATGRDLGQKLSDVLTPDQLNAINSVVGEVDRSAAVARAGNGPGSATAQRLASQNVLQQTLKETGLPVNSVAESTAIQTLMRPIQFAFNGVAEPKIQMTLGELILNPSKASAAMAAMAPAQRKALATVLANPYLKQVARQSLPATADANRR